MTAAEPTHSPWRLEARRVIAGVLAGLPADAEPALVRRAVRAAFPFGRREYHPYRCWLTACGLRFGCFPPSGRTSTGLGGGRQQCRSTRGGENG